uniref:hypothetical protein n=1 Tax=Streptomyces sp. CA-136453 TaxID=3240050 RepID=UPI003F49878B
MSTTDDEATAAFCDEYDDWFNGGYLRGLEHDRFRQTPELAARIEAVPPELDLRFRGEHLTVHTVDGIAYAVLWEEWFGKGASTWVRHTRPAAACAWARQVTAQWLHNGIGCQAGYLQSWGCRAWAAERDLIHGRWHVATGLFPGTTYASTETDDVEAGWAWMERALTAAGFPADTWPTAMLDVRDADQPTPEPEPQAPPVAPAAPAPAPQPQPTTWWTRLRHAVARALANLHRTR